MKVIAHGCNCRGVMGGGIARQIREKWPNVYETYRLQYEVMGLELGTILPVQTPDGHVIINCMTQKDFGTDKVQVDYDAVRRCIAAMDAGVSNWGVTEIGLPMIGAGLAGGDWPTIEKIIEETAKNFIPVVYILEA